MLTCTVTVVEQLTVHPTVQWTGGSVNRSASVTESETTHSGVTSSRTLIFSPFSTSHGAEYTCQAQISMPSIDVTSSDSKSRDVMVQSKSLYLYQRVGRLMTRTRLSRSVGNRLSTRLFLNGVTHDNNGGSETFFLCLFCITNVLFPYLIPIRSRRTAHHSARTSIIAHEYRLSPMHMIYRSTIIGHFHVMIIRCR